MKHDTATGGNKGSAASRFSQLNATRSTVLTRARDASALTIPSVLPRDGHSENSKLPTPYQSVGGRGVNNMAAKLLLAVLPPNTPFQRFKMDEAVKAEFDQMEEGAEIKAEIDKGLSAAEMSITNQIESYGPRPAMYEAFRHLLITGNTLVHITKRKTIRSFLLSQFVVFRSPDGVVLEIIVEEEVAPESLPEDLMGRLRSKLTGTERTLKVYTHIKRMGTYWEERQEIEGETVPGSKGRYPLDASPWIPLRMTAVSGENYGRGRVEEYYGDLMSLEKLTKAIVQGAAAAAKVLFLVNPNGTTDVRVIAKSDSGDIKSGNAEDVTVLQLNKAADFQVALALIDKIEQRMAWAFMLNSAAQRDAERVTAEEIRLMAGELEDTLGGLYSLLAAELQMPLVKRVMHTMKAEGSFPELPKDLITPVIITGIEAIGRGHDLQKLDAFLAGVGQMFGPEAVAKRVNVGAYMERRAAALGMDIEGLVLSDDELAAQAQQEQMMAMVEKLGPKGMDIVKQQLESGETDLGQQTSVPQSGQRA